MAKLPVVVAFELAVAVNTDVLLLVALS